MGNVRFKKTGNGGLKFRRNFSVEWSCIPLASEVDVVGGEGEVVAASCFGLAANQEVHILDTEFKSPGWEAVESSAGRAHKVVSGPFFKSQASSYVGGLDTITHHGAWCPTLPAGQHLNVSQKVEVDGVYEVRLIFSSGKKNGSSSLLVNEEVAVDMTDGSSHVVVGRFIATKSAASFSVRSTDPRPPLINAVVLRRIGTAPRVDATVLLG